MTHRFIHACAGSGKTQYIIDHCRKSSLNTRSIIITLTTTGQAELEDRLHENADLSASTPEVTGWYAFLINHIVRPYLPLLFPKQRVTGFIFDCGDARNKLLFTPKTDRLRYFTETGMIYKEYLEELAVQVMNKANGRVENRLHRIYDEIIIDETQDISRSGLDVIELLLRQNLSQCLFVGDSRQSLLDSNLSSRRNKKADRANLVDWYRQFEKEECLTIEEKNETYRFNQTIADFSDAIFPKKLGFASTTSRMNKQSPHDGVFLVAKEDLEQYLTIFCPTVLRSSKASWKNQDALNPINFGLAKGRTYPRVLILATNPIQEFCINGKLLSDKSACGFYVAVTRAIYSVAIAVNLSRNKLIESAPTSLPVWSP